MKKYFIAVGLIAALSIVVFAIGIKILSTRTHTHHGAGPESEEIFQSAPVASSTPDALHIPIFIYHSVRPDFASETKNQKEFSITPATLDAELKYLHDNNYTVISMDQLAFDLQNATTSGVSKPVVLTFDDGWENQYIYALPLLEKYHVTATFYIYTHPISRSPNFMTWDQVLALDKAGMTIGSHTLTHPYLSKLTPDQLHAEVFDSKKILEEHLGKPVVHFASPFGYTSPELVTLLTQAGYTTGRTTYKGSFHSKADIMRLTGYLVKPNMLDFAWAAKF